MVLTQGYIKCSNKQFVKIKGIIVIPVIIYSRNWTFTQCENCEMFVKVSKIRKRNNFNITLPPCP